MHGGLLLLSPSAEAVVLGVVEDEARGPAVILDRTIFHPQGGGQPSDRGERDTYEKSIYQYLALLGRQIGLM